MNAELFQYGILEENSDIRAHVSVVNRTIYVFPTKNGINAIKDNDPIVVNAGQEGVIGATATGWLVKPEWIEDIRRIKFYSWVGWELCNREMSTNKKGEFAVACVLELMRIGRFPMWMEEEEDKRKDVQIKGTDITVFIKKRIQVKCDYDAGEKPLGTGYLFLQKSERNPLKRHGA